MGLRALRRLYRPSLPALPCSTHAVLHRPLQIYCTLFLAIATYGQLSNRFSGITRNNLQRGVVGKGAGQARRRRAREQRADGGTQRRRQALSRTQCGNLPSGNLPSDAKTAPEGPSRTAFRPRPTLGCHSAAGRPLSVASARESFARMSAQHPDTRQRDCPFVSRERRPPESPGAPHTSKGFLSEKSWPYTPP
jgi:hypothetical protein